MRKLTANELKLAVLFSTAIFVALNLLAVRAWMQHRAGLIRDTAAAQATLLESKSWIEAASTLGSARDWIAAHPPPEDTAEQASTALLQVVRNAAAASSLKVAEENLLPAPQVQTGTAAALQTKFSGPFPGVAKFLFDLQSPDAWRSIPKMIVRSEAEPPNVVVDMEIRQYYRPSSPTATAPGP